MADHKYKLFRAVDPSQVTVPLNEKFSKLTLSSHKKRQEQRRDREPQPEEQLPQQAVAMRDNLETEQLDGSDYMEALQLSADGCSQQNTDVDVERLSASISHLTVQSKEQQQPQQVSICISSTTEEDDDDASCITISDTSEDEAQEQPDPEPDSMAVSEREPEQAPQSMLTSDKVQRIEAFLRDVKRHGGDHTPPSSLSCSSSARRRSQIAIADTESMTTPNTDEDWQPAESSPRPIDSSKRLADDDTVLDMDSSKRLADDATEANTLSSLDPESPEVKSISQRLASNDTELNTMCSHDDSHNSTLQEEDEPIPEESIEIPETCSEGEATPPRPSSGSSSSSSGDYDYEAPSVQVSSINISAKINIKISIPTMHSSSGEEQEEQVAEDVQQKISSELVDVEEQALEPQKHQKSMLSTGDASEDEQFLTQAEKLLNQLYGKAWQTPDVIRTLKRSSGSGGKTAPLKPRNMAAPPSAATTTKKKRQPVRPKPVDESVLGDFSIFTRALRTNQTPLNSTHLPPPPPPPARAVQSERRPRPQRPRTNHVDEDRWRALIDSESGTDASDDEDADATLSGSESSSDSSSDSGIKSRPKKGKDLTYLDLTKDEVEVISNPDDEDSQSPKLHRRLDDILRSCRATTKAKLPATPPPPQATTRRQLFTPNAGYEDDNEAREIVDKALDLDMLDELENDYLPGTPVYKRLQEVKRNLGIEPETPKGTPIFTKLTTPQTAPPPKSTARKKKTVQPVQVEPRGKCSFLKSLESQVSREDADNEAYFYRENFAKNKELLAQHLYKMFNTQVFNNDLDVELTWSKLLRNTAGRCMNKRKNNQRSSVVELSVKVLTTADRLRCTLIHELCHAAAWIFNGEGGHGRVWKMWAKRANDKLPDLPPIKVCHNYSIEFKYTYKCMSCNTSSHAHSRSRKVENLRCRRCRGPITLLLNKKDKQGNTVSTPAGQAKGFAKFVKENFKKFKQDHLTAAQVMRLLSVEYAKQKEGDQPAKEAATAAASIASHVETLTLDD
ncbi:uncharacterized protein LOC110182493 isoform X1 [Drosophila serrata]|uniref:uncharacterized protein LOC110182493 isoform X1 n=1 Tax=Drosophila serrata TaxID=7274 RepID=UPI000A1D3296|nr:uncharacterized protein LOC110182493 isoform X1 [Drosophila serrata]